MRRVPALSRSAIHFIAIFLSVCALRAAWGEGAEVPVPAEPPSEAAEVRAAEIRARLAAIQANLRELADERQQLRAAIRDRLNEVRRYALSMTSDDGELHAMQEKLKALKEQVHELQVEIQRRIEALPEMQEKLDEQKKAIDHNEDIDRQQRALTEEQWKLEGELKRLEAERDRAAGSPEG